MLGRPRIMVTDKLRPHGAAKAEIAPGLEHRRHKGLNYSSEASRRHARRREKIMGRFTSPRLAQRFLSMHDQTVSMFCPKRHPADRLVVEGHAKAWSDVDNLTRPLKHILAS
jgi:putative transposase